MRKIYVLLFAIAMWAACCPEPKKNDGPGTSLSPSEATNEHTEDLPYQPKKRMDWERGSNDNVPVAMNVLKSYEVKDFVSMKNYLADTVEFLSSRGNFKGTRKEMVGFMQRLRDERTDVKIEMNNYAAFKNKVRNEDWVTLWYTEKVMDKAGIAELIIINGRV